MSKTVVVESKKFQIESIGYTRGPEGGFRLEIFKPYRPGLGQLANFSHVMVFWWADQHDNVKSRQRVTTPLPYAEGVEAGVFACRSEYRPNPVAVTTCPILNIDEADGVVNIAYNDAFDNTPIIDLKPYLPVSDRVRDVKVAEWFSSWPDWYEDAGEFFAKFFSED